MSVGFALISFAKSTFGSAGAAPFTGDNLPRDSAAARAACTATFGIGCVYAPLMYV